MMRQILVYSVMFLLLSGGVLGATLGDLLWQFRESISEPDTGTSFVSDTAAMLFLNFGQHSVVTMAGYLPKSVDLTYAFDSTIYPLPSDFHQLRQPGAVMIFDGYQWLATYYNPGFSRDTTAANYDLSYVHADSARIIIRGKYLTVGNTIKVEYFARAPDMIERTDSCYVPSVLQHHIIDEAISLYERAKRNHATYQLINQIVRLDLGVIQRETGR